MIHVEEVSIEVTRRCNMKCKHCLRGNAQQKDIDLKFITTLFQKIDRIGWLYINGGEPTLVPKIIYHIAEQIQEQSVYLESFFMYINGKKIPLDFALAITYLRDLCHPVHEKDRPEVSISEDPWHEPLSKEQYQRITAMGYTYKNEKSMMQDTTINEGHAFGWSEKSMKPRKYSIRYNGDDCFINRDMYLNVDGYLIAGNDFSYENQKNHCICHVNDFSIDAIESFMNR